MRARVWRAEKASDIIVQNAAILLTPLRFTNHAFAGSLGVDVACTNIRAEQG
jgi:hypothetical protein